MPDFFVIEWEEGLAAFFKRAGDRADDMEDPLRQTGLYIQAQTVANIEGEGDLVGGWQPLSPRYEKWKEAHYSGMPMMQLHMELIEAAGAVGAVDVSDDTAIFHIDDRKAPWHHFGAERSKGGRLPERELIPDLDDEAIEQIWVEWVGDVLRGDE